LHNKQIAFITEAGTQNAIHITMVTTYGLAGEGHWAVAQSEVTLDDLFA